jgi:hypothetical protein
MSADAAMQAATQVATPIAAAASGYKIGTGGYDLVSGIANGNSDTVMSGVHDLVQGGAGALGTIPNPLSPFAKAFSAGFGLGDLIAPHIFGTEAEDNKPHMETVPEDGEFKATTGNRYIDAMFFLD